VTGLADSRTGQSGAGPVAERVARHPAAWRFLLPRHPAGPVVLANLEPVTRQNLLRSFPGAIVLGRSAAELTGAANAAVWDGRRAPLLTGRAGLVVCDDRESGTAAALAAAVGPAGQLVAIVPSARRYRFALFPTPEQLRAVVGRGWPVTFDGEPRRWLGYWLASTVAWRYLGRAGLALPSTGGSIVDIVLGQLGAALAGRAELRGLIAGRGLGQATLRVRCAGAEYAARVAVSPASEQRLANHQRAVAGVTAGLPPGQRVLALPDIVASGSADGITWTAERWVSTLSARSVMRWQPSGSGWASLQPIAAMVAASAPTGYVQPGWARGWLAEFDALAPDLAREVAAALAPIEAAGMPTAWCHGDLWPGNVIPRRSRPPVVIDWERARPDAPAGLDGLYAEVCRIAMAGQCSFGEAAARLAGSAGCRPGLAQVGGRRFSDWMAAERRALLLALATHYATGENEGGQADEWTASWCEMHVMPMVRMLRAAG